MAAQIAAGKDEKSKQNDQNDSWMRGSAWEKDGSECYLSKRWHETRVNQKISFTKDQKVILAKKNIYNKQL